MINWQRQGIGFQRKLFFNCRICFRLVSMSQRFVTTCSMLAQLRDSFNVPDREDSFLDSWKAGDYPSSFENLHRYFDYTMHNRDRTFYQYALLNLAILQADFGCYSEAMTAMNETIATARENNDTVCLNYSLSWVYHFGKAHPKQMREAQKNGILSTEREALAFLKSKAKETSMFSLLSTSLLSEAKLTLSNVVTPCPGTSLQQH